MGRKTFAWLVTERDRIRSELRKAKSSVDYNALRVRYYRVVDLIDKMTVRGLQRTWHPEGR